MTSTSKLAPAEIRAAITAAISCFAKAHNRPVDDTLLQRAATVIVETSGRWHRTLLHPQIEDQLLELMLSYGPDPCASERKRRSRKMRAIIGRTVPPHVLLDHLYSRTAARLAAVRLATTVHDFLQHGRGDDAVMLVLDRAQTIGHKHATDKHWQRFAALCERAVAAEIERIAPPGVAWQPSNSTEARIGRLRS
jgi:hypothetical protein